MKAVWGAAAGFTITLFVPVVRALSRGIHLEPIVLVPIGATALAGVALKLMKDDSFQSWLSR